MHGRPGPNDTPYDLRDEVVANVDDDEANFAIITEDGEIVRYLPNDLEPYSAIRRDIGSGRLGIEEDDVEQIVHLGDVFWDIDERDSVRLVRVEKKVAYDKKGDHMHDSGLYVVLEYDFAAFPGPHGAQTTEQRFSLNKFYELVTTGKRHNLKCFANHDDKSLDDFRFMRRRKHRDPSSLPP